MALHVWLPLLGDLTNNGIGNPTLSVDNATVDNSGKLGKCYNFNGSTSCINITYSEIPNILNGDFSICMWIYNNDNGGRSILFGSYALTGGFFNLEKQTNNKIRFYWNGSPDYNPGNAVLTTSAWTHLIITRKDTLISIYINGVLTDQGTYTLSTVPSTNVNYRLGRDSRSDATAFNGKMNDFRLYSHALSPKEIEILSRGLVVHYPMTGGGRSGDNLVVGTQRNQYSNDLTLDNDRKSGMLSAGSGGNGVFSITEEDVPVGIYSYNVTNNTSGNRDYQQGGIPFISGKQYTASWWAKGNGACLFRSWNRTRGAEVIRDTYTLTSNWKYYTRTFTATQAMQDDCCTFHLGVTGNASIKIAGMKLEEGSHATPWIPNSADTAYTTMGYNDNTEYDTSGYLHDGTTSGVSYSSDSARYSVSTVFDANADTVTIPSAFSVSQTMRELSVSIWFKSNTLNSTSPNFFSLGENAFIRARTSNGQSIWCYYRTSTETTAVNMRSYTFACKNILDNNWHHLVCTFKDGISKCYIDGSIIGTNDNTSDGLYLMCSSTAWHLAGYAANSENFIGSLSDFRLYATALSATQVAELYNTSASISNNGILLGYELVEQ